MFVTFPAQYINKTILCWLYHRKDFKLYWWRG